MKMRSFVPRERCERSVTVDSGVYFG
jgi:hypothetical protein